MVAVNQPTNTHTHTGTWVYPTFGNALEEAGFYTISEYILRRRATLVDNVAVAQYV
jgi:hypothetical protein